MAEIRRGPIVVDVAVVLAPDGDRRVKLQLPDGFVLLLADDARAVARALTSGAMLLDGRGPNG